MSRSGYSDEGDHVYLYRAAVDRAMRGARGQHFLRKLRDALDAMPVKRLITSEIANGSGEVCALGAVDPNPKGDIYEPREMAAHYGIAPAMAAEIVYMNDEWLWRTNETPEERWARMRAWVDQQIVPYGDEGAA